jgi:hypothetical protein
VTGPEWDAAEATSGYRLPWPWVAAFTVVAGLAIVLHSPLLAVSHIDVVGARRSDAVARVADSGVGEGALLLWVDTGAVHRAVAADPWVRRVTVDRVWPNRLVVEVVERQPVMWVEGIGGWMLVSTDGAVLERSGAPTGDLLRAAIAFPDRVPGEVPSDPVWHEVVAMAQVLADGIGPGLLVEMVGTQLWTTVSGFEVRLGHPVDLADKARALVALLAEPLPPGTRIDVTSPQRPAVVPPEPRAGVEG